MIVGHRIGFISARPVTNLRECGPECHAFLLALAAKLVALFGAIWAIFWRSPPATMPRIYFFRAITLILAFLAAFTFWLFYWVSDISQFFYLQRRASNFGNYRSVKTGITDYRLVDYRVSSVVLPVNYRKIKLFIRHNKWCKNEQVNTNFDTDAVQHLTT